jgi:hypothetical protein
MVVYGIVQRRVYRLEEHKKNKTWIFSLVVVERDKSDKWLAFF